MYQSLPAEYEGKSGQIDLISYEEDQFRWAAEDLIAGDISDVAEGNGVLTVYDKKQLSEGWRHHLAGAGQSLQ